MMTIIFLILFIVNVFYTFHLVKTEEYHAAIINSFAAGMVFVYLILMISETNFK